jgi:hypothetical protein
MDQIGTDSDRKTRPSYPRAIVGIGQTSIGGIHRTMKTIPAPASEAALLARIESLNSMVQSGLESVRTIQMSRRTITQALAIGFPSLSPNQTK